MRELVGRDRQGLRFSLAGEGGDTEGKPILPLIGSPGSLGW